MKIKDLPKLEMPREKLARYGVGRMANHELLAILLGSGIKGVNVLELSKKVLQVVDKVGIDTVTTIDLQKIKGLGVAKTSEIIACIELGRRLLKDKKTTLLLSPADVWEAMADIRSSKREHFVVFYLDSRSQEIKREIVSVGTINESLVHPREVFEQAILHNATTIIAAHNHPSGDTSPSPADIAVTKKLKTAGELLDIKLLDHIIVAKDTFSSLKELDLM